MRIIVNRTADIPSLDWQRLVSKRQPAKNCRHIGIERFETSEKIHGDLTVQHQPGSLRLEYSARTGLPEKPRNDQIIHGLEPIHDPGFRPAPKLELQEVENRIRAFERISNDGKPEISVKFRSAQILAYIPRGGVLSELSLPAMCRLRVNALGEADIAGSGKPVEIELQRRAPGL